MHQNVYIYIYIYIYIHFDAKSLILGRNHFSLIYEFISFLSMLAIP